MCEKALRTFIILLRNIGAPHVSFHLCRDYSLDYVTLTFGLRREGSVSKGELNQTNICLNPNGADPPVVS